jgi:peptidoglycan/xylan/chitin deacetylase (PgdA/CDA1 family)
MIKDCMEISSSTQQGGLPLSFVVNAGQVGTLFAQQFYRDMDSARLSLAFRCYYQLRKFIPISLRQLLQRHRNSRIDVRPGWFIPNGFVGKLERAISDQGPLATIHPWPDRSQYSFVLTHDVETAEGLGKIPKVAAIEEELGFRSSWAFVPHAYKIDMGLVRDLIDRGFEVAIHGYNHDGRLFTSKRIFTARSIAINNAVGRFQAAGFRAPMVHRNLDWLQMLDVEYDASCFDIDPYQAMPGGVGSIWPFMAGKLVELPYTMPQDHTLMVTLGEADDATWRAKFDYLVKRSGLVLMLTHPDYMNSLERRSVYRSFLEHARERGDYWHALPREVARWWRNREDSHIDGGTRIIGPAAERGSICSLRVESDGLIFDFQ